MKNIAFILSGCGVFDGSEIHEACAAMLALQRAGCKIHFCAPQGPQMHVMNHLAGEPAAAVAADLGLSLNSVLLAKSRVLKRMRAELAGLTE